MEQHEKKELSRNKIFIPPIWLEMEINGSELISPLYNIKQNNSFHYHFSLLILNYSIPPKPKASLVYLIIIALL